MLASEWSVTTDLTIFGIPVVQSEAAPAGGAIYVADPSGSGSASLVLLNPADVYALQYHLDPDLWLSAALGYHVHRAHMRLDALARSL